jgi:hypothetical protein
LPTSLATNGFVTWRRFYRLGFLGAIVCTSPIDMGRFGREQRPAPDDCITSHEIPVHIGTVATGSFGSSPRYSRESEDPPLRLPAPHQVTYQPPMDSCFRRSDGEWVILAQNITNGPQTVHKNRKTPGRASNPGHGRPGEWLSRSPVPFYGPAYMLS